MQVHILKKNHDFLTRWSHEIKATFLIILVGIWVSFCRDVLLLIGYVKCDVTSATICKDSSVKASQKHRTKILHL